jgi:hypothetical protein
MILFVEMNRVVSILSLREQLHVYYTEKQAWRDGVDKAAAQGGGIADVAGPNELITAQTQSHGPKMLQAEGNFSHPPNIFFTSKKFGKRKPNFFLV